MARSARRGLPRVGKPQRQIEHAFEFGGSSRHLIVLPTLIVEDAEVFVGDVQRCQDGEFQRVACRGFLEGKPHLLVDVSGQLGHVGWIESAPDRVLLSVDLDGHDTRPALVHGGSTG